MSLKMISNIGVLASGTLISQLILFATLPLITRIYSPKDFEILALFNSVVAILSVAICLRFDIAILTAKRYKEARLILTTSLYCCLALSLLLFFILACWIMFDDSIILESKLGEYCFLIPVAVFFTGIFNSIQSWATRDKHFRKITNAKVRKTLFSVMAQVSIGFIYSSPVGLLIGNISNNLSGTVYLFKKTLRQKKELFKLKRKKLLYVLTKYKNYPKYSVVEALANSLSAQLPIIIISTYSVGPEAGFLFLAIKVIGAPMALLGLSISQVYVSEAKTKLEEGKLDEFTFYLINKLIYFVVIPISLVGVLSPLMFPLIFGENWQRAGQIVLILTPSYILQMLTSPVSMSLHITNNLALAMRIQIFGSIVRIGSVLVVGFLANEYLVLAFSLSGVMFYSVYLLTICSAVGLTNSKKILILCKAISLFFLILIIFKALELAFL